MNLTILPTINPLPYDEYRQVIVESGIKVVETAGSSPAPQPARLGAFRLSDGRTLREECYCIREVSDPRHIIDTLARIVTVSLETMSIVDALPALVIRTDQSPS